MGTMRAFAVLTGACTLLFFTAGIAHAWDSVGHMLIAQIAQDQLSPAAKASAEELLRQFNEGKKGDRMPADEPYDFVVASCWMDDIRSLPTKYNFGPWHYVNLPFNADGLPEPSSGEGPNLIWALQHCSDILEGKAQDPSIDRAQALVMLLHLAGDAHQPLHATNRGGDAGGNRVALPNVEKSDEENLFGRGRESNLHAFWDSAYRRIFRDGKARVAYEPPLYDEARPVVGHRSASEAVRREAKVIEGKFPPPVDQKTPEAWVHDSHATGYDLGYEKLPGGSSKKILLDARYVDSAREASQRAVATAGYRLGALLNGLLAPRAP